MPRNNTLATKRKVSGEEAKRAISKTKVEAAARPPRKGKAPAAASSSIVTSGAAKLFGGDGLMAFGWTAQSAIDSKETKELNRLGTSRAEQARQWGEEARLEREVRVIEFAESSKNDICDCRENPTSTSSKPSFLCRVHHCYAEEIGACNDCWSGTKVQQIRYPDGDSKWPYPTRRRDECRECLDWSSNSDTCSCPRDGGWREDACREDHSALYRAKTCSARAATRRKRWGMPERGEVSPFLDLCCTCLEDGCPMFCKESHVIESDWRPAGWPSSRPAPFHGTQRVNQR
jgi:hypothetical protein